MLKPKITNEKKFSQVSEVEFSSKYIHRGSFDGNIYIQLKNGTELESDGDHSVNDWEEDYGFVVVEEEE